MTRMWEQAHALQVELVRLRRAVHEQPELAFQEFRTAELVTDTLGSLGFHVRTGVGKTGVLAEMGQGRPCMAVRADMDALPIQEMNVAPYHSQVSGVMHACGHDAHVAMALGAAMLLSREALPGQVRFLFQPAEERTDKEGVSGAMRMMEDGALEGVDAVIALHVAPGLRTGCIQIGPGPACATTEAFHGIIRGQGCHGAYPHTGLDPVFLASQVISAIHAIVSRHVDPMQSAVISIGQISGGTEFNIIPTEVTLAGTIRSFEEEVREKLHEELRRAFDIARALGGDYELHVNTENIALFNDSRISALIGKVAGDLLGEERVLPLIPTMGGEDFGYMTRQVPGAMFRLGTGSGEVRIIHSPYFDIDEAVLPIGTALLAETVWRYLQLNKTDPA